MLSAPNPWCATSPGALGAAAGASVLYFDYRLAPEHPFPAAVEDAGKVYRWLARRMDPSRIVSVGDSAGGGLVFATLHKMRDEGHAMPRAAVAISPWTDLALTGRSLHTNAKTDPMMDVRHLPIFAAHYLGGADPRHPYASPLYGDCPVCRRCSSKSVVTRFCATTPCAGRESCALPEAT